MRGTYAAAGIIGPRNYSMSSLFRERRRVEHNNMKGNRSKNLPAFRSVDELVAFFETHDMGEYWEKLPEVEVEVSIRNSKRVSTKTKTNSNTGKRWTPTQVTQLRKLASQNTPTRVIGLKLGRTENAVRTKASEKGVSLKWRNHSSFYRSKK